MKITGITEFKRKSDNKPYWRITLEGEDLPLLTFSKPEYSEGADIPKENLTISKDGKYYTMPTKRATLTKAAFRDDDVIMMQTAFKGAIEAEKIWYVPDGKAHNDRVLVNTSELFAGLLLMKPKKEQS